MLNREKCPYPSTSAPSVFILESQSMRSVKLHCSLFLTGSTDKTHPMLQHSFLCWVLRGRKLQQFLFFVSRLICRWISACGNAISVSLGTLKAWHLWIALGECVRGRDRVKEEVVAALWALCSCCGLSAPTEQHHSSLTLSPLF